MTTILVRSNAKINLGLSVLGKNEDGYHQLDMVMLPIALHDSILIKKLVSTNDHYVTIDDFSLEHVEYNVATKAIEVLADHYQFNTKFRVTIHKVIPMKAGLGGGSSNAAFTMKGIDQLMKLHSDDQTLYELSKKVGSDVPFFIYDKPARCQGRGEILTPITVKNDYYVLLVKPKEGCATKAVFELSDKTSYHNCNIEKVIQALADGDDDTLAKEMHNALEEAACLLVPEIKVVKDKLYQAGFKMVMMSGSGSTVYALSHDKKLVNQVAQSLEDDYEVIVSKVIK